MSICRRIFAALLFCAPSLFAGDLSTALTAIDQPSLGKSVAIDSLKFSVSNMTFELGPGTAAPLVANGEQVGVFFTGRGHYTYRSAEPTESPLVQFEAKKVGISSKATGGAVVLDGEIKRIAIRASGVALPPLGDAEPKEDDLPRAFETHQKKFSNVFWTPASHLIWRQKRDAPASQVVVATISGDEEAGYVLDSVDAKREALYSMRSMNSWEVEGLRRGIDPYPVSEQPLGHKRAEFSQPPYLLVDVDYQLTEQKGQARFTVTETFVPRTASVSTLRLNLSSGTWDDDGHFHARQVDSVTDEQGKKLPFQHSFGSILVEVPKTAAGEPITLRFDMSGDFLVRPNNDSYWQLGTGAWFPRPDLNGQFHTVHGTVRVRKPWIPFASGETVERKEEGEYNVLEVRIDHPVQFPVVHAGKYYLYEEKFDGLTVRVATYAAENQRAMKQMATLTYGLVKYYEPWLGPFPFKNLDIVQINDVGWGQAPPATMLITNEVFNPLQYTTNRLDARDVNQRFAHELAHQYWGHVVKMGSEEEQWITEAFAEFCSGRAMKTLQGERAYSNIVARWRAGAKEAGTFSPVVLANRVFIPSNPDETWKTRTALMYSKGAYALSVLEEQMGERKFSLFLRNVQGRFAWRFVTTRDLAAVANAVDPGKDYQSFFDRYIWGTELPATK